MNDTYYCEQCDCRHVLEPIEWLDEPIVVPRPSEWTVDLHDSSDDTAIILKAADEHGMSA